MDIILNIHSIVRYLIILFALWTVIGAFIGMSQQKSYATIAKPHMFYMVFADVQLLLGLILLYNRISISNIGEIGMGAVMKDKMMRFQIVEHPLMMLIAIVLLHISRSAAKKAATDQKKLKITLIWGGIALLLILASIPWPFREVIGRPLF